MQRPYTATPAAPHRGFVCGQRPLIRRVCRARAAGEARPVRVACPHPCCPPRCTHSLCCPHTGPDPAPHAHTRATRPHRPPAPARTRPHRPDAPPARPRSSAPPQIFAIGLIDLSNAWLAEIETGRRDLHNCANLLNQTCGLVKEREEGSHWTESDSARTQRKPFTRHGLSRAWLVVMHRDGFSALPEYEPGERARAEPALDPPRRSDERALQYAHRSSVASVASVQPLGARSFSLVTASQPPAPRAFRCVMCL